MIRKITLLAFLLISSISFSQIGPVGHLTIFSEDGDRFTLILNGEVINDTPQTNLRVEDLNQPYYNAKIRFEDKTLADVSKNNLMIADVDGIFSDVTYKIRRDKNNKTKMKLNYFSSIPVQPDFIPASNVHVIHYGQPRPVATQQVITQPVGGVSQTTTTTTTQTGGTNVGVGVNVGGINMGISINDGMGTGVVTQTTTTTTNHSNTVIVDHDEPVRGCNGRSCMTSGNFNAALATIKQQSFEDTQLKTAKQVITANCLNVDQIIQIANTFSFEDNKLAFAKFAYDYCIEPRNYFKLNGIFSFSSNVDELSDYVQSRQ
ncbi:DUF4476 domain-containing protein [Flavobacterium dankookense]|uniref:Uncharacterized protein DUF4476 n=1 Tax=Flavobacterium dankookense TaxID=706186 RepID=A0A4R6QB60_9FLAO|nr:DUF4476 domain-containing protein [Flavobacterium dankookense]TDP59440.1 uncharacterized protein DUF4476 [Flavobacterium dankookense]